MRFLPFLPCFKAAIYFAKLNREWCPEYMYLKTAYASMVWMYASKLELQTRPKQFVKIYVNMFFEILLKS